VASLTVGVVPSTAEDPAGRAVLSAVSERFRNGSKAARSTPAGAGDSESADSYILDGEIAHHDTNGVGGLPIGAPIAHYGPFVMNSRGEIIQALEDYQAGRLGIVPGDQLGPRNFA
jgi:hypothetical protein